jgi:two-component system KDP operon response regulator KdpE
MRRAVIARANTLNGVVQVRDLVIDLVKRRVRFKGKELHLTPIEYNLLSILASHPGRVMTNQSLIASIWGDERKPPTQYLRVYVNTLRSKLDERADSPFHYIINEPGIGYRFTDLT